MGLAAPWDKLLPEMRMRLREIVKAIRDDTRMPEPPTDHQEDDTLKRCAVCGKRTYPRGLHAHMRSHRNFDSWIKP